MIKYTINKVFKRILPHQIWKIQVDEASSHFAVELRDASSSIASIYVFDFEGRPVLSDFILPEKEWTLDAIQRERLILKRVGEQSPVKAGLMILTIQGEKILEDDAHTLLATYDRAVQARHRNFASGFETFFRLADGKTTKSASESYPNSTIQVPHLYHGELPAFLKNKPIADGIWISKSADYFLWSYHQKTDDTYALNLCISDHSKIVHEIVLLHDMPKMIPQPYFQIGRQLFVLAYNKCEILSYLV